MGQSFTIRILPSRSMMVALISPTFSFSRISWGSLPSTICCRISGTHLGHSESVERGHPSGGLVVAHDFRIGLSDDSGLNADAGLMRLTRSQTAHAPFPAYVKTFSAYLTGLCMRFAFSPAPRCGATLHPKCVS